MKFSIVTLSFGQGQYLPTAIEPILEQRQEGRDVEYIVTDPGSRDNSHAILDQCKSDIDTIALERDCGPADGLNKGFDKATGEVFGFVSADDRLEPGALETVGVYCERSPSCGATMRALRPSRHLRHNGHYPQRRPTPSIRCLRAG